MNAQKKLPTTEEVRAFIATLQYPKFAAYMVGHLQKEYGISREEAVALWDKAHE